MLRALERGISIADFELLTFGMIVDIIIASNNEHYGAAEDEQEIRLATQADFDRF